MTTGSGGGHGDPNQPSDGPGGVPSPFGHGAPGGDAGSGGSVAPGPPAASMPPAGPGGWIAPGYGPPQGYGPPGSGPAGYGQPGYGYGYPVAVVRGTNGFAIASLICAFACSPLGLIFGFVSRSQIKQTGESGDGLAMAGIIVSAVFMALFVLYIVFVVAIFGAAIHNIPNVVVPTPTP